MEKERTQEGPSAGSRVLSQVFVGRHPEEAARMIERARIPEIARLLEQTPTAACAELVKHLTAETTAQALGHMQPDAIRRLLEGCDPQRCASVVARLDGDDRQRITALLEPRLAEELSWLAEHPPDTAGGMMDPRVTSFPPGTNVGDAILHLRAQTRKRIHDVFLIDADGVLRGSVALVDVLLAEHAAPLDTLVRGELLSVPVTATQGEVLEELERRPMRSLAVVDIDGRLVGALRQGQLIAAAQEDATSDALRLVGASRDERALSKPLFAVRKRLPWLQINLLTAFLAASVVALFEGTIARFTALAVLLPVVAGQSGNTGAQALAVTMRGLALREIRARHWLHVSMKELVVGAVNGVAVALTTSLGVLIWSRSFGLALVIALSMVISMVAAGLSGALVPMVLTALRQDPAQSSSIVLTTVTDVVGFFSFLGIATLLSSLL